MSETIGRKTTIYICLDGCFPHGDAGANRVCQLAKAFAGAGYGVHIISFSAARTVSDTEGFAVSAVCIGTGGAAKLKKKTVGGYLAAKALGRLKPDQEDAVLIYGTNSLYAGPILRYCLRKGIRVGLDVVEWHQPFQYKHGARSLAYRSSKRTFETLAVRAGNVIAISSLIREYYCEKGCHAEIFPPMCDTAGIAFHPAPRPDGRCVLIYPGNPFYKDDIVTMIKGMAMLTEPEREKLVFHVTGIDRAALEAFWNEAAPVLDSLGSALCLHGRLPYDELLALYDRAEFLYMSRPDNIVTRANFPSKVPELMCRGIVPVCNRVGDYHEYLHDGADAVIFEENTPEACAAALRRVIGMSEADAARMRESARRCAETAFDHRVWIEKAAAFIGNMK